DRARELARSLQTRDVTVGGQIERHEPDPGVTFGITLSIPLFTNYYYEGEVARAESDVEAARESLEKTVALARTEMARAVTELTAAIDRLHRLDDEVLPEARGVAEAAEFAYAKGAIGLTDLLDARRTLRAVELDSVNARLDHAKARSAWLAASEWESVAP
ncbi:MAG TPA: TolC family protein, partial [Rhodocyclaceae bacterium]|nr:TolC family protein [Rhodocyclaceae bacterium]